MVGAFLELNHIEKVLSVGKYNISPKAMETMAFDCVLCSTL